MPPVHAEVRLTIHSRYEEIDLVDALAEAVLKYAKFSGEDLEHASLAVREAAANAVEHGNGQHSEKPVEVVMRVNARVLTIRVRDQGNGFDPLALPDPLAPENLLKPKGRGVFLMQRFMDEVDFDFAPGTVVTMRKHLAAPTTDKQTEEEV